VPDAGPEPPDPGLPSPWQRPGDVPAGGSRAVGSPTAAPASGEPLYAGPPRTQPPPLGWRPPMVVQPPVPRHLPPQDPARLDADERGARTLTLGIGMIGGAVVLIVTCMLCSRLLL